MASTRCRCCLPRHPGVLTGGRPSGRESLANVCPDVREWGRPRCVNTEAATHQPTQPEGGLVSMMPPDSDRKIAPQPCTTIGCPEPATLVGTLTDHDVVYEAVTYCTYCAGYLYQQFEITGPVDGDPEVDDCGHHSWAGLMALLDEHWPEGIFPTREDDEARDAGARIVSLIRWVDRLRGDV